MMRAHATFERTGRWWIGRAVIIAAMALFIGGCGGPATHTADGKTIVRLVVTRPTNPAAWDEALNRLHAAHSDISVELITRPNDATQFRTTLINQMRAGDANLDVFMMDVIWPSEFGAKNWALPVNDRFAAEERATFFPGCIDSVTYDGKIYGVPLFTDSGMLYYRRDLLEKHGFAGPPSTWSEMLDQIEKIREAENDPNLVGYSGQFAQYEGLVCNMLEFVASNGGDMLDPSAEATMQAVTFVREKLIGRAAPEGSLNDQEESSLVRFKNGQAIFHRNWPYAWAVCNDETQSQVVGRVGIARLPAFEGHAPVAALGGWSLGIHAKTRHPDAAWTVVNFMTSPEIQKLLALESGLAPTRRNVYDDPEVTTKNPHFSAMKHVFETATPRPKTPVYARISTTLQRYFSDAINPAVTLDLPASAARTTREIATIRDSIE